LVLAALVIGAGSDALAQQAWQKEWADTVAKAKGQALALSVHSIEGHEQVVQEFQKKFPGINVSTTVVGPQNFAPRVITEQKNGVFVWDSWWANTANMNNTVLPTGGFDKISDYFILPEVKDMANWQAPEFLYTSDAGPYIFIHTNYLSTTTYINNDVVKGLDVKTPEDLFNPKLKGNIAVRDPSRPNAGSYALASILRDKGGDFLKRFFAEMDPLVIDNPRLLTDNVTKGEKAVVIGASPDSIAACQANGGCASVNTLPFGSFILSRGVSVMKNAPHKEATKVWVNWLLSKEGQETYVRIWGGLNDDGGVSMRKDVAPFPKHARGVPDFANMKAVLLPGTDEGERYLSEVAKIYAETRKSR
jgi:iron(III) transport system substrate-binding protein